MKKLRNPSPTELELPFDYDTAPAREQLTALAGIPLAVRTFRSLGLGKSVNQNVVIKQRDRGLDEAAYVESFVVLNAAGGDCVDDFGQLRADQGLQRLIGHEVPSPEAARKFLKAFHEEANVIEAQQALGLGQVSYIPEENGALRGLGQVNEDLVREFGRRCADQKIATIDLDATVIESWKQQAKMSYQGERGYQPMVALWAEMNVVVADEFRDGNVPAIQAPLSVARRAFAALPETVTEYYFRGDSACHEQELMKWLRDENREGGPRGAIRFAISVRMNATLRAKIGQLPGCLWKPYREDSETTVECTEVSNYWPEADEEKAYGPLRYVAVRVRKKQGSLFADGNEVKYFAVVTNEWEWKAKRLLEWHREKAGSIEAVHDVLKNELAGGTMPSKYFGVNAAWFRLAVIRHNVLSALKRLALPPEMMTARPKRLRFLIFQTAGRIIQHARRLICRVAVLQERLQMWEQANRNLPILA
jgi:hypothetical protein